MKKSRLGNFGFRLSEFLKEHKQVIFVWIGLFILSVGTGYELMYSLLIAVLGAAVMYIGMSLELIISTIFVVLINVLSNFVENVFKIWVDDIEKLKYTMTFIGEHSIESIGILFIPLLAIKLLRVTWSRL